MFRIHLHYWVALARNRIRYWSIRARIALTVWPRLAFWGPILLILGGRKALDEAKAKGKRMAEADPKYQRTVAETRQLEEETRQMEAETRRIEDETRRIKDEILALRHQDIQGDRS